MSEGTEQLERGIEPKEGVVFFKAGRINLEEKVLLVPSGVVLKGSGKERTTIKAGAVVLGKDCEICEISVDALVIHPKGLKERKSSLKQRLVLESEEFLERLLRESEGKVKLSKKSFKLLSSETLKDSLSLKNAFFVALDAKFKKPLSFYECSCIFKNCRFKDADLKINCGDALAEGCFFEDFSQSLSALKVAEGYLAASGCSFKNFAGSHHRGAVGIYGLKSRLTLKNCSFENFSSYSASIRLKEGFLKIQNSTFCNFSFAEGIGLARGGEAEISKCSFKKFDGVSTALMLSGARAYLKGCSFKDFVGDKTYSVYALFEGYVEVSDTDFEEFKDKAAAVVCTEKSTCRLTGCTFKGFVNGSNAGRFTDKSVAEVFKCTFKDFSKTSCGCWASGEGTAGVISDCEFESFGENSYAVLSFFSAKTEVKNCTFSGFEGDSSSGAWADYGGFLSVRDCELKGFKDKASGVLLTSGSSAKVSDCLFEDFIGESEAVAADSGTAHLGKCRFLNFKSDARAVSVSLDGYAELKECSFKKFEESDGILVSDEGVALAKDCQFGKFENKSFGACVEAQGSLEAKNCRFKDFSASDGVFALKNCLCKLSECSFKGFQNSNGVFAQELFKGQVELLNCSFKGFFGKEARGVRGELNSSPVALFDCSFLGFEQDAVKIEAYVKVV